jgi:hypothetical protein
MSTIHTGTPFSNYKCLVMDKFSQSVIIGQEGELVVGDVGVFAGYLQRADLTERARFEIDDELFYRTGDLVRLDNNGFLHYRGRKDQIKLHGQRIELGEIERCLLNTSITACVVIKWGDDHLIAYVQSSNIDEKQLREYCQLHLLPHMIPSIFIVLQQLPLNANGKVDRKLLPSPNLSSLTLSSPNEPNTPNNQLEERVHDVWCQILRCIGKQIPTTVNFFSIGGHSLFAFDNHILSITLFLQQSTIVQHSQLLQTVIINDMKSIQWHPLHINQGNKF